MAINTTCPSCREEYRVPRSQQGKRVQCLNCKKNFVVTGEYDQEDEDLPVLHEDAGYSRRDDRGRRDRDEPRRPAPRRRDYEDDRDDRDDREEREPKATSWTAFFVVAAVLLVVLLVGGGVTIWALSGRSPQPVAGNNPQPQPGQGGNGEQPKVEAPRPTDVTSALAAVADPAPERKRQGVEFLVSANVEEDRREQVELALETYEEDPQLAALVERALKRWGTPKNEVPRLIRRLKSSRAGVAEAAMEELSKRDDERAVAALAFQLGTPGRANEVVKHLEAAGPRCEKYVLPYYNHPRPYARQAARQVLESIGTSKEALIKQCLLDLRNQQDLNEHPDKSPRTQRANAAFESLAKLSPGKVEVDNTRAAKLFEEAAVAKGPRRRDALGALEKWATKDNVPAVLEIAKDTTWAEHANKVLMKFPDDERVAPVFAGVLWDSNQCANACKVLLAMGEKAEYAVLPLLDQPNEQVQKVAVVLLGEGVGTKLSIPRLNLMAARYVRTDKKLSNDVIAYRKKIEAREKAKADAAKEKDKEKDKDR